MNNRNGLPPLPDPSSDRLPREDEAVRSHLLPRTRSGWVAVLLFLGLLALAEPPFVHSVANRIEPLVFGLPFLYVYLLGIYLALIGVLVWAWRRRL
jgi:hypothetical protein